MSLPREKPDAVLCPRPFAATANRRSNEDDHKLLKDKFAKTLGVSRVYTSNQGNQYFVRGNADLTLLYGSLHPLNPSEQLDWYVVQESRDTPPLAEPLPVESWTDHPAAIKFGYIKDADRVDPPSSAAKDEHNRALATQQIDYHVKASRHAELMAKLAKGGPVALDGAEHEELQALQAYFVDWATNGPPNPTDRKIVGV